MEINFYFVVIIPILFIFILAMERKEKNILLFIMVISIVVLGVLYSPIGSPTIYEPNAYIFKSGVNMDLNYTNKYVSRVNQIVASDVANNTVVVDDYFNYSVIQTVKINDVDDNVLNQGVSFQETSFVGNKTNQIVSNTPEMKPLFSLNNSYKTTTKKNGFISISTTIDDIGGRRFLSNGNNGNGNGNNNNNNNGNGHNEHGNGNGYDDDCDDDENPIPVGDGLPILILFTIIYLSIKIFFK